MIDRLKPRVYNNTHFGVIASGISGNLASYSSATGGTIATNGDYKIHSFTSSGTFTVTQLGDSPNDVADILVVAGGGGGGGNHAAGGGAGGVIFKPSHAVTAQSYSVVVGAGGAGGAAYGSNSGAVGIVGADSSFDGLISKGGGFGGTWNNVGPWTSGGNGGSGGGGLVGNGGTDGTGIQTTQSGDSGTYGFGTSPSSNTMSGGGGSGGVNVVGVGGSGIGGTVNSDINTILIQASAGVLDGTDRYISAGGNSVVAPTDPSTRGGGGIYLGAGVSNTGSGGGGGAGGGPVIAGGAGGSGIVILRYKFQ